VILETALADALYLNWAIPEAALPELPAELRYDTVVDGGKSWGFFSLVLFRQVGLHWRSASWLTLSYPQANARFYVRDSEAVPAVFLWKQLAPAWVVPIARIVAHQPISAGLLDFPRAGLAGIDGAQRWRAHAGKGLEFVAEAGSSPPGSPRLGEWDATATFFRERSRAYWRLGESLRWTETEHPAADALPMSVEVVNVDWLDTFLPFAPASSWSALHSSFLVPRVRLAFLLGTRPELAVPARAAAAG
jgi:uncharacterized protein YqjF (DUF2071 family)